MGKAGIIIMKEAPSTRCCVQCGEGGRSVGVGGGRGGGGGGGGGVGLPGGRCKLEVH